MDEPVVASLAPEALLPRIPWTATDDLISHSVHFPFALIDAVQKEECVGWTAVIRDFFHACAQCSPAFG